MRSGDPTLSFPLPSFLGSHASVSEAREALRRSISPDWHVWFWDGHSPHFQAYRAIERRGCLYHATVDVQLLGQAGGLWTAEAGSLYEQLMYRPAPPLSGIRPEVLRLEQLLTSGQGSHALLPVLGAIEGPLSDEEAAFLAVRLPDAAEDSDLAPVAQALMEAIQTAVSWAGVVLADVPNHSNSWIQGLKAAARRALGLDGSWLRERHLPQDFPAALWPEARPKCTPEEAAALGWRFAGVHHALLYDQGPNGWYERWESLAHPNESATVLLEQDTPRPWHWQEQDLGLAPFMEGTCDAIFLVQDPAFSDGEQDEEQAGLTHLADLYGWKGVFDAVMSVLRDDGCAENWATAAATLWRLQDRWPERRTGSDDVWIGHLYHAVDRAPALGVNLEGSDFENLAWGITAKLRGLPDLSEYEPREDPRVRAVMEAIARQEREDAERPGREPAP
ncbi:hypothetical protein [Deinococcus sp. QL22]|uniref:hypothetical protein n=1 Tax=Deinococcus sp. QL22 TaxID=2939437 RepID=UPI002017FE68|nr:hypothetical protein [Deinococcus sp. QL22]UQN06469.1 hypothetical protein M1R55_00700 [Deinococcus sp. QL22]